jgi:hypothetical protein
MPTVLDIFMLSLLLSPPSPAREGIAFERQDRCIQARLIPLAKTTSITITFCCEGGELISVEEYRGPTEGLDINYRDLRSGLFRVRMRTEPGAGLRLSLSSDYFTTATSVLMFNPGLQKYWLQEPDAHLRRAAPNLRSLNLRVMPRDGSEMDIDGAENGVIELVVGPRDSFWGYALGTLFIRFFGIFIVLGILMAGMMLAGKIFRMMERPTATPREVGPPVETSPENDLLPEQIAALALALHLQQQHKPASGPATFAAGVNWVQAGRLQLMRGVRLPRRPAGKE